MISREELVQDGERLVESSRNIIADFRACDSLDMNMLLSVRNALKTLQKSFIILLDYVRDTMDNSKEDIHIGGWLHSNIETLGEIARDEIDPKIVELASTDVKASLILKEAMTKKEDEK